MAKKGHSSPNLWGGENYYDQSGKKTGYSMKNGWGGVVSQGLGTSMLQTTRKSAKAFRMAWTGTITMIRTAKRPATACLMYMMGRICMEQTGKRKAIVTGQGW